MSAISEIPNRSTQSAPIFGQSDIAANRRHHLREQLVRFGMVGILNTTVDVLVLNLLIWLLRIHSTPMLLAANAVAYATGAVQSFILNKHWTFRQHKAITASEVMRFVVVTLCGIALNDALLWSVGLALLPLVGATVLWANLTKGIAIGGTVLLSYLGMRLWVFSTRYQRSRIASEAVEHQQRLALSMVLAHHGISVVLPAFNEEAVIGTTVADILSVLHEWGADFEVLVVNDGSRDRTSAIVEALAKRDPRVHLISHASNQGYGAALADGFAAATKDLTFFMDSDGQFAIRDLARLLVEIEDADAVLGYRQQRQDSWIRSVNAWAWNVLVALTLGVRVRDLDCAFKLLRTDFLHTYPPETRSALINAELLFKLNRSGATYRQIGVRHLPRQGGRPTGANPQVILRAVRDLVTHAQRWRQQRYPIQVSKVTTASH